ncbi:MAG: tRNA-(ms[2]io[6]A)-hydroxylase [Gammaproteobacteria bacterium]|nr:tRNA-(ms[2]io[6]A)-hydroxylase [Gammaproteobacteria bacterium]MBT8150870.1 tRNA-(ms[2]io[6]A)-hydroxylase [Gammaproteobacteria bacterium]
MKKVGPVAFDETALLEKAGIDRFLLCPTPEPWLASAINCIPLLLVDHANCEKKAASTALQLLYRYTENSKLLHKMSRLAREELRHFEQVLAQMQRLDIQYEQLSAARYAGALHAEIRKPEPARLIDTLIVGAFIEARSCERFARLVPLLKQVDEELAVFYASLLKSEARHYRDYLSLAETAAGDAGIDRSSVDQRIVAIAQREAELVQSPDAEFRFHSGVPA